MNTSIIFVVLFIQCIGSIAFFLPNFRKIDTLKQAHQNDSTGLQNNNGGIIPVGEVMLNLDRNDKSVGVGFNKYYKIIDSLSPNEMLLRFAKSAPPHVQSAAKSTIMNIFGSLPNYALDASLVTTNTKLANLLYQMQITGYMFKNAEYRMSLTKSLKGTTYRNSVFSFLFFYYFTS